MYFNEENNSTNIDMEFDDGKNKFNFLNNKNILIGVVLIVVLLIVGIVMIIVPRLMKKEYYLVLNGLEDMTIYQNSVFVDPGYQAYDNKGQEYNHEVVITGSVNTEVAGEYTIEYMFNDVIKKRIVTVIGDINQVTYLNLLGSPIMYLKVGEVYTEPGYVVLDSVVDDLEKRVVIVGDVNTKKAGTYKIVYSVINNAGVTITAERTVIVMDTDIHLSYSPTKYTNDLVTVTVNVVANYFDYVLLPDNTKSSERMATYKVSKNGEYTFKVYDSDGNFKISNIKIINIDKEVPSGSCTAIYNGSKTEVSVMANDNIGIESYNYIINGSENGYITKNKYSYLGDGTSVMVDVRDKRSNLLFFWFFR